MTDATTRFPTALIFSIAPLAGNASRVELVARINGDQWVVLQLSRDEMERRGLVVGARIKVDHRPGGFALA